MTTPDSITFVFQDIDLFPFPEDKFRKWIFDVINSERKTPGMLNYILCSDAYLLEMNKTYLSHDTLTDIITFDYSEDFGDISGDIFISIERVEENAKQFEVEFIHELSRVLAHGVLHICGYKDKTTRQKQTMREKENHYLELIDF